MAATEGNERRRIPISAYPRVAWRTMVDPYGRALFINMWKTKIQSILANHGFTTMQNVEYIGYYVEEERYAFEYSVEPGGTYMFYWSLPSDTEAEAVEKLVDKNNLHLEWYTKWYNIRKFPMNYAFTKMSLGTDGRLYLHTEFLTAPPNAIVANVSWEYTTDADALHQNRILAWQRVWRGRGTVRFLTSPALWRFLTSSGVVALLVALAKWWTQPPSS